MKDGQIAYQGNPNEIIQPGIMQHIYEIDIAVHEINGKRIAVYYT
jgi:iron complex transport system ATP-binding protein